MSCFTPEALEFTVETLERSLDRIDLCVNLVKTRGWAGSTQTGHVRRRKLTGFRDFSSRGAEVTTVGWTGSIAGFPAKQIGNTTHPLHRETLN